MIKTLKVFRSIVNKDGTLLSILNLNCFYKCMQELRIFKREIKWASY